MKITATKVASTKTHEAYKVTFQIGGETSAIFRADHEGIDVKQESIEAVIAEIRKCVVEVVE